MTETRYCRLCGAGIAKGEKICPSCGRIQARPIGIMVISILAFLVGVFALLAGVGLQVTSGFAVSFLQSAALSATFFYILAASMAFMGVVFIASGIGLLKLKPWGWWLAVIGGLGSIAFSVYGSMIPPLTTSTFTFTLVEREGIILWLAISVVIIIYLTVRRGFFGRVTRISKSRLIGLAVIAILPFIISGTSSAAIATQLPQEESLEATWPTPPPEPIPIWSDSQESTWREILTITQLTHNTANDLAPSISSDGSKIAFQSDVDGDWEIFLVNFDGSGLIQLTHNAAVDCNPSISSDGSKIAFTSTLEGDSGIFTVNSDGSGLKQLTYNVNDALPSISGDGSKIAFQSYVDGDLEIFVVNSDGSGLIQLTHNTFPDWSPSISGDGSKVTFYSYMDGAFGEIFVVNSDGSGLIQLTHNTAVDDLNPSISGDGSKIVFESCWDVEREREGEWEIFVVNSDGSGLKQLTHNTVNDLSPSISGNGSKIAFYSHVDGDLEIFMVNSDGSGLRQLTKDIFTYFPTTAPSISGDGSKIVFESDVDGDSEIFLCQEEE